jgi:hypothetical protein
MYRSPVSVLGKARGTIEDGKSQTAIQPTRSGERSAIAGLRNTARFRSGNSKKIRALGSTTSTSGWAQRSASDEVAASQPTNGVPGGVPPRSTTLVAGRKNDKTNRTQATATTTVPGNHQILMDWRCITDQRSMACTAPQFTRTLDAGPVHCGVWLCLVRSTLRKIFFKPIEKVDDFRRGVLGKRNRDSSEFPCR